MHTEILGPSGDFYRSCPMEDSCWAKFLPKHVRAPRDTFRVPTNTFRTLTGKLACPPNRQSAHQTFFGPHRGIISRCRAGELRYCVLLSSKCFCVFCFCDDKYTFFGLPWGMENLGHLCTADILLKWHFLS